MSNKKSKYVPVWKYLHRQNNDSLILSFEEIEKILGFPIDHSFLNSKKEAKEYGYRVEKISLKEKKITFVKINAKR